MKRQLNPDISALIHHIQLNESGWMDVAINRTIKFIMWVADTPINAANILELHKDMGLSHLTPKSIDKALSELVDNGDIVKTSADKFTLSVGQQKNISDSVSEAESTERAVREKIIRTARPFTKTLSKEKEEDIWNKFHKYFVIPFITDSGAHTYELIIGDTSPAGPSSLIQNVEKHIPELNKSAIESLIFALFDRNDKNCQSYILRLLNNYFFQTASRLPDETIKKIYHEGKTKIKIRLLLDTNFLFSLLSLHSNPSNEAVESLISLLLSMPEHIDIGLYILPETIDEFKRSMNHHEYVASNIRVTRNIVDAGISARISGVIEKYLERCRESGYSISPQDYFSPYQNNLEEILKEKGIQVLRLRKDQYLEDQRVIDDAIDRDSYYKRRFISQPERQKPYDQIWHDVLLWHVIHDKRPTFTENIFDVDWMGVTIDYTLIAFDHRKRSGKGIPLITHPASLAKALQTIIPAGEQLDDAIFSLMQLPFMSNDFDVEDEKATVKILSQLSRFENIDDIGTETISQILANDALKNKIQKTDEEEEEFLLVKDAIIEQTKEIESERDFAEKVLSATKLELEEAQNEYSRSKINLQEKIQETLVEKELEVSKKKETEEELQKLQTENDKLIHKLRLADQKKRQMGRAMRISIGGSALTAIVIMILYAISWSFLLSHLGKVSAAALLLSPIPIIVKYIESQISKDSNQIEGSYLFKILKATSNLIWWLYAAILLAFLSPFLNEIANDAEKARDQINK